ncbi:sugar porter family MFS transporter [Komagataeibacter melaceti]|uniref:Sugar porter family MFS transporter n=1 Tax=Komagataeibacter melaceti TaxID=2766577 RepID=A0A371Z1R3_9PROT|nr:sugar porter family MFS transporter [Komagataeibacter melaceti]
MPRGRVNVLQPATSSVSTGNTPATAPAPTSPGSQAVRAALTTAAAGLLVGLDTGLIAEALGFIGRDFHASARMQEWIVSVLMVGALLGSLGAGVFSRRFGRKLTLGTATLLIGLGALLCATAGMIGQILLGRFLIGMAIGICTFTAPLYISELTTGVMRGTMVSTFSMLQSAGILLGYLAGGIFSGGGHWRLMVGLPVIPAAVLCVGCVFLPASPSWLAARGRFEEARRVLRSLRGDEEMADRELDNIRHELGEGRPVGGFALLRSKPYFRRSVALGVGLQVMQQLTGINVVLYYAPKILEGAHFGTSAAAWATVLVGVINAVIGVVAVYMVSRWGRRPLLAASCIIMAAALAVAAVIEGLHLQGTGATFSLMGALLVFVAGFGMGAGPLVWTLCSEIQPIEGRDFGVACSTLANWGMDWGVSNTFLSIVAVAGAGWTFAGFSALNVAFLLFTLLLVPETRNVPLEVIEQHLEAGRPLREIGR